MSTARRERVTISDIAAQLGISKASVSYALNGRPGVSAETRARLDAEYDAMVRSAGVGGSGESTVLQIVELLEKATDTELQIIRADTAVRTARAELWRYLPADQFSSTAKQELP